MGPVTPEERSAVINNSPLHGRYEEVIDRESAYERLKNRTESAPAVKPAPKSPPRRRSDTPFEAMTKSAARSFGRQLATAGRQATTEIIRGVLGSILGGTRRR